MGMGGQRQTPAALLPGKRPGVHCTGDWWTPQPVWTGAEILVPPFRSELLYRLSYRGHKIQCNMAPKYQFKLSPANNSETPFIRRIGREGLFSMRRMTTGLLQVQSEVRRASVCRQPFPMSE